MVGQSFPGLGGNDAAGVTFQKRYARIRFDAAQARAAPWVMLPASATQRNR